MAAFGSRAAEKLRGQHSVAGSLTIFLRTNPFNLQESQYQRVAGVKLSRPTQDTLEIAGVVNRLLKDIFRAEYAYQKVVM